MKFLRKLVKVVIGILLVPVCVGAVITLIVIASRSQFIPLIGTYVLAGAMSWIIVYIFIPEPKWIYVLGHELTHAIWSFGFGGKLKKLRVGSEGGHVLITKSNFLTTLAPYFFPFYVVILLLIFLIGNYFWDWSPFILWFYYLMGALYAFHVTLTFSTLKIKQPDIIQEGYIFSFIIIFLGNLVVLLIGIPLLTKKITIYSSFEMWFTQTWHIYIYLSKFLGF